MPDDATPPEGIHTDDERPDDVHTAMARSAVDGPYEWFVEGSRLLDSGRPTDAAVLLSRVVTADPTSRSAWEGLARAWFDSQEFERAAQSFTRLVELAPDSDYAHFGLGLSLWRLQRFPEARDHLGMAVVMRPDRVEYATALGQVKATLSARRTAGLPLRGAVDGPAVGR